MSTVEELQAQLDAQRVQHAKDMQAAQATLAKLQEDLTLMQTDTDELEKEEAELYRQFGQGRNVAAASDEPGYRDLVVQALRGLVECDDSKCSSA